MAARMLLQRRGLDYDDVLITSNPDRREEMIARSGKQTVRQIMIGEQAQR